MSTGVAFLEAPLRAAGCCFPARGKSRTVGGEPFYGSRIICTLRTSMSAAFLMLVGLMRN